MNETIVNQYWIFRNAGSTGMNVGRSNMDRLAMSAEYDVTHHTSSVWTDSAIESKSNGQFFMRLNDATFALPRESIRIPFELDWYVIVNW
jgi:hypothetical protein